MEGILMILASHLSPASDNCILQKSLLWWVIFGINLMFGATQIGFLIAFIWSVWPQQTVLTSIITNDL